MSKRRDHVLEDVYRKHLAGGGAYRTNTSDDELAILERMYIRVLSEMAINRFRWVGLPSTVNERYLELMLYRHALSVFYYDDEYNAYMALQGSPNGPMNMYQDPTGFRVVGNSTFVGKSLSVTECVPIWANVLRSPDLDIVVTYARRLASIDRTIDINAKNARRTKVIVANENQRHSATEINNQLEKGSAAIYVNPMGMDLVSEMTAVDLGVHPDMVEKLQIARGRLWNECMGLLGLNFANQDKRERMVVDEVSANDEQVDNMRAVALNERKRACVLINNKYDLSVDVKFNVDIPTQIGFVGGEV